MSNRQYTYVGAFLELTNIWTTETIEVSSCPNHGQRGAGWVGMNGDTKPFCPECGSKIVKIAKEKKVRKHFCGDWDGKKEEWVDTMFLASTDVDQKEDFIILLPNLRDSGQIQGIFDGSEKPICVIEEDASFECIKALHAKCFDYIQWLINFRKFDVCTKFGIVKYWN